MSRNSYGTLFCITTFGESHGAAIGVIVDGVESGLTLTEAIIQKDLDRRRPGQSVLTTSRNEQDCVEILSGVFEQKTTGQPICLLIRNHNQNSKDYNSIQSLLRPGHANMTYQEKWGIFDHRGGGRASARETAARVAAGAIAKLVVEKEGIKVLAYVKQVGHIQAQNLQLEFIDQLPNKESNLIRCPDVEKTLEMQQLILDVKNQGDSIGGIIEAQVIGIPTGLGEPVFDKLDAELAKALMSIGSVKGVEFGTGFALASMRGSECNDPFYHTGQKIATRTNHSGGILGGISNGMPLVLRAAFKPPSSIAIPTETIDANNQSAHISVTGRHDPCVLPRAVPIVEAMICCVLADFIYRQKINQK